MFDVANLLGFAAVSVFMAILVKFSEYRPSND